LLSLDPPAYARGKKTLIDGQPAVYDFIRGLWPQMKATPVGSISA
jgi:hypothetical protein